MGGGGKYSPGQYVSSSFPNAASTNKSGHIFRWAGSNLCPCWLGMGGGGKVQAGTICFIIISKCSFCKQEWDTYSGGQVVISAPDGGEGGGKGQYRPEHCVSSSFPNSASANKSGHIQGVAGSNLCPCLLGRGGGDSTGKDNVFQHHFQMQLLQHKSGQVVISAPVGRKWGGGDITGHDNVLHHHFQMLLSQSRGDIFRGGR
jgi:hypothetical protein